MAEMMQEFITRERERLHGEREALFTQQHELETKLVGINRELAAIDAYEAAKTGNLSLRLGLGWSKSNSFHTGQTPVLRYNLQLMMALLNDRLPIAKIVNAKAISLEDAPKGYAEFDKGIAAKFVLDPHGLLAKAA